MPFAMAGYELAHHGEGRWNGVAIASRVGISGVVTNFGDGPVRRSPRARTPAAPKRPPTREAEASMKRPADEARMISARLRRRPRGQHLRAERAGARHAVLSRQAGLVRPAGPLAARDPGSERDRS
jgi:exonuclease III